MHKEKNITLVPTRIIISSAFNILDSIILNNKSLFEIANPKSTNDAVDIIEAKNWIASTTKKSIKKKNLGKSPRFLLYIHTSLRLKRFIEFIGRESYVCIVYELNLFVS